MKQKKEKETSIDEKLNQRFEQELDSVSNARHKKGGTKKINKVWERIGKLKQKHNRIAGQYEIKATEHEGIATTFQYKRVKKVIKDDKKRVFIL